MGRDEMRDALRPRCMQERYEQKEREVGAELHARSTSA